MSDNDTALDTHFQQRMSQLIRRMKANGTTPYGSEHCVYTRQKLQLEMAAIALRHKRHVDTATYMDAEMERIQSLPGLESDILVYLQAMSDQIRLCLDVWSYCKEHDNLADVIVHLAFGRGNPVGTA